MPRFILHIGQHKTGTTYLQSCFLKLQPLLRSRGIHYPDEWQGGHGPGLFGLFQRLKALDESLTPEFDALRRSSAETILISAEDLSALHGPALAYFRRLIGESPFTIVFYYRSWSEMLPSAWQEIVKHGSSTTLPEFVASHTAAPRKSDIINFGTKIDRYISAFGEDSMRLVSYNDVRDTNTDLFAHFCQEFLDWPDAPIHPQIVNPSLDLFDTEILRALNSINETSGAGLHGGFHIPFLQSKQKLDLRPLMAVMERHVDLAQINDDSDTLPGLHQELLEKYRNSIIPRKSREHLFRPRNQRHKYINERYQNEPLAVQGLQFLYSLLVETINRPQQPTERQSDTGPAATTESSSSPKRLVLAEPESPASPASPYLAPASPADDGPKPGNAPSRAKIGSERPMPEPSNTEKPNAWPYRADRPQRYAANYERYINRGGLVRLEDDVRGFTSGNYNVNDMARFYFFSLVSDQIGKERLIGDFAELGVYKGHTATLLATMARRFNTTAYFLDTFEGFDQNDLQGIDSGVSQAAFSDTSLEAVQALVGQGNTRFIKGYFPETARQIPSGTRFALVHIDCDLYAPIKSALEYFYPRMIPGGFMVIHDYSSLHWNGAEKAVDEFFADKPESPIPLTDSAGSVTIRKAKSSSANDNWLIQKRCALLGRNWTDASNGNLAELLGVGWGNAERWGVWGIGGSHEMFLALPTSIRQDVSLEADVHVVLGGSRTSQEVDVLVNGELATSWTFAPGRNRDIRSVRISPPTSSEAAGPFRSLHLEFRPHSVASPFALNTGSSDKRELGLGLYRLRYQPC